MREVKLIFILMLIFAIGANAQITLGLCHEKARDNYPLIKQFGLIEQTEKFNISNANKGYLPQVSLSARASYQSEVTKIPESLGQILSQLSGRDVTFATLSQDQYQAVVEANQLIWDGGVIAAQKKISTASSEVERQKVEVDLFALNERVNQIFFGILLLDEQLKQSEILKSELQTNYDRLNACVHNGVANQTDLDIIKVEQLNIVQRETEIKSSREAYFTMLSALTGLEIDKNEMLEKPLIDRGILDETKIQRPELAFFDVQYNLYDTQKSILNAANRPKVGAFLQGGYGKPALNMFDDGFSPFYIGGVRLTWNLGGFYSIKNQFNQLEIDKEKVGVQRETFLFNTNLMVNQHKAEIEKLAILIGSDEEIIILRGQIKKVAIVKVENGTLTSSDLVREINAEDQARRMKSLHEIQQLMAIYKLKNTINN